MGFWIFALCCNLVVPLIMVAGGWMLWKHGNKTDTWFGGYRARRSFFDEESWVYVRGTLGRFWFQLGLVLLIPSVLCLCPFIHYAKKSQGVISYVMVIAMFIQFFLLFIPIVAAEISLSRRMNGKGVAYEKKTDDTDERADDAVSDGMQQQE